MSNLELKNTEDVPQEIENIVNPVLDSEIKKSGDGKTEEDLRKEKVRKMNYYDVSNVEIFSIEDLKERLSLISMEIEKYERKKSN